MILKKIRSVIDSGEKNEILSNVFSLSFLQASNYIFPIITLPYLVRVLGPEKFGLVAFAQAFIQYFSIITDYGFKISGTREISRARDDVENISLIFSTILFVKVVLLLFSLIVLILLVLYIPIFNQNSILYFLAFGTVVGNVFFPHWFFQGIEKMKYISMINIFTRLIYTIAIFLFIHAPQDYLYVPALYSIAMIINGIIGIVFVINKFKLRFRFPSMEGIYTQMIKGWHVFVSTVAISVYTSSNTFVLGILTNNTLVGYYAAVEKLLRAGQGIMEPLSQSIFPHIVSLAKKSKEDALKFIRKMMFLIGGSTLIVSIMIFFFARAIIHLVLGPLYVNSIIILKILSILPFIIGLSNIFGVQTMITFDYELAFSRILIMASILNIILLFILIPLFQLIGVSVSIVSSEIIVTLSMYYFLKWKGISLIYNNTR